MTGDTSAAGTVWHNRRLLSRPILSSRRDDNIDLASIVGPCPHHGPCALTVNLAR